MPLHTPLAAPPAGPRVSEEHLRAAILVGHGSLRPGAGAAMIGLAERAQALGIAPIVAAGFLNYSQPTFAETLAGCVERGATEVIVQPYFLIPGKFVRDDLARRVEAGRAAYPGCSIYMAPPFGDHPALAQLLIKRAQQVEGAMGRAGEEATVVRPTVHSPHRPLGRQHSGLLIMAHGSPDPRSNAPIYGIARRVRAGGRYAAVIVGYLDLNTPRILDAIDAMVARGISHIIAVPYFLQLGNHVAGDLPEVIGEARARHPSATILLAEHLGYDELLLEVIAERFREVRECFR